MSIETYLQQKKALVEDGLRRVRFHPQGLSRRHFEAMNYSLEAGGKRVRPVLCLATAEALGAAPQSCLPVACALECIHTYSLIHDDLPAMDNDELRRGKPTSHMVYGEAGAILAGDGLQAYAFELLSAPWPGEPLPPADRLRIIHLVSRAIGPEGMVGGQALDIESENQDIPFETLRAIHARKTGALITASVQAGAILGRASDNAFARLTEYGNGIGLAFQIVDDLLNVTSTTEQLGKMAGSDAHRRKATYPALFGIDGTRERAAVAVRNAVAALEGFDAQADPLRQLATYILDRSH